ncbi:AP-3 complex subunit beta-1-like [Dioscorea cayenensis subsp. rotundata]|uniref:AP-3 complex subunit beta-1-like n=1 Tax=Dioscorea cayennensis subsp. rotundata TaxID=55577 RepID=A0AB40CMT2_DIOCR|nr:AP-3 complex subunit beta-1-like [Dioscorea cayenensis subsp. rotundata]
MGRASSGSEEKLGFWAVPKGASVKVKKEKGVESSGEKQPQGRGEKLRPFRFENMRGEDEEEEEKEINGDDKNMNEDEDEDDENYKETSNAEFEDSETTSASGGDSLVFSLKKRKFSGTETLVSISEEKSGSEEALSSGSLENPQQKHKRSRFCSEKFGRKKKEKHGTVKDANVIDVKDAEFRKRGRGQ